MARWCGNDRGPDKIVEGAYLHVKGEIIAIAFSKKGKFQCPEEVPTVAVHEMQTLHEYIRKGSTVKHICLTYILI